MSSEVSPARAGAERAAKKALRKVQSVNLQELERRVHIAELRAREAEAEVRYMVASQTRREMRSDKRDKGKGDKKDKGRARNRDRDDADIAD